MIHSVTNSQLEVIIQENAIVFIDFWASWCAPCEAFGRVYKDVAETNPTIYFGKVNIEEEKELAELFQIQSIPHLLIFKEGIVIYSASGSMPKSMLEDLLQQAIEADLTEIRKKIDEGEI